MWNLLILSLITTAALADVSLSGKFAFEWTSSSLFPNGTVVQACAGDNVTFPWDFDMTSPGQVSIEWIKASEDHHKRKVRAAYTGDKFSKLQVERELEFLPKAGIMLPEVTLEDIGYYIVEIVLQGDPQLYKQGAFLHVSDIPLTTSGELHAFILPERIYSSTTGQWHVQLGCRPPVIQGQPALPVIWTTPSHRTVVSTSNNNNTFILRFPNPVEEGDYSCSLNTSVPSVKCLSTQLDISHAATVHVKGDNNARLSNVEGNVETLWKVTNNLNDSVCQLSDIVQNIQASYQRCCEEVKIVNDTTNNFQNETELLTTVMNIIRKENNNATSTIFELQTKNEEIITRVIDLENTTSVTAKALGHLQNKYDIMSSAIQSMHDNLTDMDQSNFDKITDMVQNKHDNTAVEINKTLENMTDLKIKNENLTRVLGILQSKYDKQAAQNLQLESKYDNVTAQNLQLESKYDNLTANYAKLESKYDNVTAPNLQLESKYNLTANYAKLESKYDNVTAQNLQLESKYDNLTANYAKLESKYDNVTAQNLQLESKYDNLTANYAKLESKYDNVTAQNLQLESKYDNLTANYAKLESKYDNITAPNLQLESKYDNVTAPNLQLESKYDNLTANYAKLESKYDNVTANYVKLESKYDNVTANYAKLESKYDNLTAQNLQLESKYDNVTAQNLQLESKYDNVTAQNLQLESKYDNVTAQNLQLESKYDNVTANYAKLESMYDTLTARFLQLESRYDNATVQHSQLESKYDNVTAKYLQLESKYDNVTAKYLQLESNVLYLHSDEVELLPVPSTDDRDKKPASCDDVKKYDNMSGPHTLFLSDNKIIKVYCDQTTDNGGWTVFQRRQDGSVDFYRNWEQYERGFGNLSTEFWIGLANLYHLTKSQRFRLRVDLTDFDGSTAYAVYNTFNISGPEDNYRLYVGGYNGTAGDSLFEHNRLQFTTYDRDNDAASGNCALIVRGAWWYKACHPSALNGLYKPNGTKGWDGVIWRYWKSDNRSLKRTEMKLKP